MTLQDKACPGHREVQQTPAIRVSTENRRAETHTLAILKQIKRIMSVCMGSFSSMIIVFSVGRGARLGLLTCHVMKL